MLKSFFFRGVCACLIEAYSRQQAAYYLATGLVARRKVKVPNSAREPSVLGDGHRDPTPPTIMMPQIRSN